MPRNPPPPWKPAASAAPFFAEEVPASRQFKPPTVEWGECIERPRDKSGHIVVWPGKVPGSKPGASLAGVRVRAVRKGRILTDFTWLVVSPVVRIQGRAESEAEAFEMVVHAVASAQLLGRRVQELRRLFHKPLEPAPVPTQDEERVFQAVELLVGVRPVYSPYQGARAWNLREDDIPEERLDDWNRHGHTVCSMLRDLSR